MIAGFAGTAINDVNLQRLLFGGSAMAVKQVCQAVVDHGHLETCRFVHLGEHDRMVQSSEKASKVG